MHPFIRGLWRRLRFVRYSIRAIGLRKLVKSSLRLAADRDAREHDSGFDARFGTDTTTGVTPDDAALPDERRDGATMYLPTMDVDFAAMLDALAWPDELVARSTFVDIGSGKGRVVLLAAMRPTPFRAVMGVELSAPLQEVARSNVEIVQARGALRSPVTLATTDAASLEVPDGAVVLYLYHPFREDVCAALVDRVLASLAEVPRPIAIVYGHPMLARPLDETVFRRGDVFRKATEGARTTQSFRIAWSIWTNLAWLALPLAKAA